MGLKSLPVENFLLTGSPSRLGSDVQRAIQTVQKPFVHPNAQSEFVFVLYQHWQGSSCLPQGTRSYSMDSAMAIDTENDVSKWLPVRMKIGHVE